MKINKYEVKSTKDLQKLEKTIKMITGLLAGALIVLFVVAVILSIKQGFSPLVIIPFALLPIVGLNLNNLKVIKQELNTRKITP